MELDQLKNQWRKEMQTAQHNGGTSFVDLQKNISSLNRLSLYEDVRDISLWLIVTAFFGLHWILASNIHWFERTGLIIILFTCFFIIYKTLEVRAVGSSGNWTLSARVSSEISRIEKKIRLLNWTTTGYLMPLYVGLFLVPIDRLHDKTGAYVINSSHFYYCLFCLAAGGVGYWCVQRTIKKQYSPVLTDLKELRFELAKN